jgi:hypothetical protein
MIKSIIFLQYNVRSEPIYETSIEWQIAPGDRPINGSQLIITPTNKLPADWPLQETLYFYMKLDYSPNSNLSTIDYNYANMVSI